MERRPDLPAKSRIGTKPKTERKGQAEIDLEQASPPLLSPLFSTVPRALRRGCLALLWRVSEARMNVTITIKKRDNGRE
jgi:hypothetical protein